jgi:hypothetical protein
VPDEIAEHPDIVEAWRYSEAAANLHQQLHNLPEQRPRWMTLHNVTGKPVFSDDVATEGMGMLEYMAGWYKKHIEAHSDFFAFYSRAGMDANAELSRYPHYRKYRRGALSRAFVIGFDRTDLIRFLDDARVGIAHRLRGGDDGSGQSVQPLPQQRHQDQEVLAVPGGLHNQLPAGEPKTEARTAPRLTLPDKSDTWAKAIEATYELMVGENGGTPSGLEVWLRMNHKPPANYPIMVTKDRGLAAIAMPGEKLLTRDGFTKRWRRYTATT